MYEPKLPPEIRRSVKEVCKEAEKAWRTVKPFCEELAPMVQEVHNVAEKVRTPGIDQNQFIRPLDALQTGLDVGLFVERDHRNGYFHFFF